MYNELFIVKAITGVINQSISVKVTALEEKVILLQSEREDMEESMISREEIEKSFDIKLQQHIQMKENEIEMHVGMYRSGL